MAKEQKKPSKATLPDVTGESLIPPSFDLKQYTPAVRKQVHEMADKLAHGEVSEVVKIFEDCLKQVKNRSYQEGYKDGYKEGEQDASNEK